MLTGPDDVRFLGSDAIDRKRTSGTVARAPPGFPGP